jgi:hypothetical protein
MQILRTLGGLSSRALFAFMSWSFGTGTDAVLSLCNIKNSRWKLYLIFCLENCEYTGNKNLTRNECLAADHTFSVWLTTEAQWIIFFTCRTPGIPPNLLSDRFYLSQWLKRIRYEVTAKFKNAWIFTSTFFIHVHDVVLRHRSSVTFPWNEDVPGEYELPALVPFTVKLWW